MEVAPGAGRIVTREKFGDVQLHVEWAAPIEIRGNSGQRISGRRRQDAGLLADVGECSVAVVAIQAAGFMRQAHGPAVNRRAAPVAGRILSAGLNLLLIEDRIVAYK